ncbi:MAG: VCBS repeat-containing protein [Bacteroidales bacterium]
MGPITKADTVLVQWPDRRITLLTGVPTDTTLVLYQKDGTLPDSDPLPVRSTSSPLLTRLDASRWFDFTHRENDFIDFRRDRLLYHMLSTEGPRMCRGDVNGDGRDDVFVGGAKDQPGVLMLQRPDGSFRPSEDPVFLADKISEDTDCAFLDADGDGDLDLYVASGGNELPTSSSALADRLYLNDGRGRFTKSKQVLPAGKYESTGSLQAADFDGDGITELFVGLRLRPFLYGVPVQGYLLENDGEGNFRNATKELAPGLENLGMIRDMRWADVDGDGDLDMILAGDWMALTVFLNENGRFVPKPDAFAEDTRGWWNCLVTGDFDGDGDLDFAAGNHGLNSRFKAGPERPVQMWVNDFDLNGSVEQIICTFEGDSAYPLALKHDLLAQLPRLATKYPTYKTYVEQTITDIFSPNQLENALLLEVAQLRSSLFLNDGTGTFERRDLPEALQLSPVMALYSDDFNGDGRPDLLSGGNLHRVKPEVGRYDASYGQLLLGDGTGGFRALPTWQSGMMLDGEIRDILEVETARGPVLLFSASDGPVQVYQARSQTQGP